jgi:hypothetical protein
VATLSAGGHAGNEAGDGAALLALSGSFVATRRTMGSVPLPVGEARRLADTDVTNARLFPDGRLLYTLDANDGHPYQSPLP